MIYTTNSISYINLFIFPFPIKYIGSAYQFSRLFQKSTKITIQKGWEKLVFIHSIKYKLSHLQLVCTI